MIYIIRHGQTELNTAHVLQGIVFSYVYTGQNISEIVQFTLRIILMGKTGLKKIYKKQYRS